MTIWNYIYVTKNIIERSPDQYDLAKEIVLTIKEILYNLDERRDDDTYWQNVVSRVEKWNREVGFDLQFNSNKQCQFQSVILPIFYAKINIGNRQKTTDLQVTY